MAADSPSGSTSADGVTWLFDRIRSSARRPRGLLEAWEGAQAETSPKAKIFLQQGMVVWCAYYLSKSGAQQSSSFAGQARDGHVFNTHVY
ncbi:hypothetical protein F5883DRAFT_31804 [Diaporthe sp. PMI_573]|nr:hypothetical protein F5883DRAFT_31804 [Diaporthaceae sp. PMI_573]